MPTTKAGWAEVDITPPLGLPMGGRGARFTPGASVLDPLYASALMLEDGDGRRLLLVSFDLIGMSLRTSAALRFELAALTGIPYDAVVLNFAHPHSGPMTTIDRYAADVTVTPELAAYDDHLLRMVLRLACEAQEALTPVDIRVHTGRSDVGINRRNRDEDGMMGLRPNPDGLYNPDLWILDITARRGGGRCMAFSYACHPVLVYGFAWDAISSDYVGVCRRTLKARVGERTHCQFFQGTAGNVRPRVVADPEHNRFRKSTPADVEYTGTTLANDIVRALGNEGQPVKPALHAVAGRVLLHRDETVRYPLEHWQRLAASDDELQRNLGRYWAQRLQEGIPPVKAVPWEIGLIRLSERHRIAWFAGEAVAEWLGHLRHWLQDDDLTVWGYCQETPGYLPTDELIPEGGYEVVQSNLHGKEGPGPFALGLNETMRQGFEALVRRIAEK